MPGFAFVMGGCCLCGRIISFNPNHVPSVRAVRKKIGGVDTFICSDDPKVPRQALCPGCARETNAKMEKPRLIHPLAYEGSPIEEMDL